MYYSRVHCDTCDHESICKIKELYSAYISAFKRAETESLSVVADEKLRKTIQDKFFTSSVCQFWTPPVLNKKAPEAYGENPVIDLEK